MKKGAVLLAANMQSKTKGFVPLLEIGSITVIERVTATLLQAGVDKIVLVTGEDAQAVEKRISHMGIICLRAEDYQKADMFSAAKIGFAYLLTLCDKIVFCPVDIPLFTAKTVRDLMNSNELIVSPSYQGRGGHPMVLSSSVLKAILLYDGGGGILEAIRSCGMERKWLEVNDEGTMLNLTKTEVSNDLVASHKKQMLHPQLKLSIAKEQVFFGPGPEQLLDLIETTGSVRNACQLMNISYSKGWKMIRLMEEQWGYAIVERKQGGLSGGSSSLTEEGKDLCSRYKKFQIEVKKQTENLFQKYFAELQ